MAPFLEFEGKNIEAAVKKACEELNISESQLKHDVISFGASGIFGLVGAKKARIRVTLPKIAPEPEPVIQINDDNAKSKDEDEDEDEVEDQIIETEMKSSNDALLQESISDDLVAFGQNALQKIVDLITTDATITESKLSDRIAFTIKGGNSALLIGKRGQTLEAIQYIISKIVNKNYENRIRIHIDVEGYLESKRASLTDRAVRLAEKVKRTGKPVTIGIMNGYDRRVVHLALKEDRAVTTKSIGDDFYRKLVIFPRRWNSNKKKP
ncbi:MAG: Jag N-terminal domain-containing protein [Deltaproteobacteria bacterium]|nr:Jag N-terminal domain-containing protein [Deltaproteobacteria bacterium]